MMRIPIAKLFFVLTIALSTTTTSVVLGQCTSDEACTDDGTFCGRDGNCTIFSCQNWFENGPTEFTGLTEGAEIPSLTCQNYATATEDNANSVVFGCRPYSPTKKAPEAKTWTYFFNQECMASPGGGGKQFKCYENGPNTDYREYQGEAARINLPSCDREIFDNEQPLYWYIREASAQTKDGEVVGSYGKGRDNTASGDSFNANQADKTMYAVLITDAGEITPTGGSEGTTDITSGAGTSTTRMFSAIAAISLVGNLVINWFA